MLMFQIRLYCYNLYMNNRQNQQVLLRCMLMYMIDMFLRLCLKSLLYHLNLMYLPIHLFLNFLKFLLNH